MVKKFTGPMLIFEVLKNANPCLDNTSSFSPSQYILKIVQINNILTYLKTDLNLFKYQCPEE